MTVGLIPLLSSNDDANPGNELGLPLDGHRVITPEEFRSGVVSLDLDPWLLRYLADHPQGMQRLTPWEYQELMADVIRRHGGYTVTLGPRGRDGGVDVFAERQGATGPELLLVQCKHPKPTNKVDVDTVRLLHYQVVQRDATRGLVTTSSTFTSAALKEIAEHRYRMGAADHARVQGWLSELKNRYT